MTEATQFASAVYEGHVVHRRHTPVPHQFRYRMAQLYLDLAELDQVFAHRWLWSHGRRNLAEFRRSDYLGDPHCPLDAAVRACVLRASGIELDGPIRLLTHLRYAGYLFNPVSFYYCFSRGGEALRCVVAEITNTPWKERHNYVLATSRAQRRGNDWSWTFDKAFHVSPFMQMDCRYAWQFSAPGERLGVRMRVERHGRRAFDATLDLKARPLNGASLSRVLARYPLMTGQVILAIYWQALRLWLKRAPVYTHPTQREEVPRG